MTPAAFGTLPDGRTVRAITLRGGGLTARVLNHGAIVQDLRLDGVAHPLVLGCPDPADYLGNGRYFGAIVGRFANRIGGARFAIDGTEYRTDPNFRDAHTLHGGWHGTDIHQWQIDAFASDRITLSLSLPDGHMGFPGRMQITAQIGLADRALTFTLLARTDKATPCSLTHHGFFDLDGNGDIRNHRLMIAADHYLPVDHNLIPVGDIAPVVGTAFDFRQPRMIGDAGYDHNFCLSDGPRAIRPVALLTGANGLSMQVETTACGLQFYDGAYMVGVPGLGGRVYHPHAGLALEAQSWPDAPNQPHFPDAILRPGRIWSETTRYRFLP